MKKQKVKILLLITMIVILTISMVACSPPFKEAPQGLSEDNRIYTAIADKRMDAVAPDYKGYIFKKDDRAFCFRFKAPKTIQQDKTYPLIIFLHGSGDWGNNNSSHMYKSLIDNVAKFVEEDVFVFMPQSIKKHSWEETNEHGKGISDLYNLALDEILKTFTIDTNRIYLTGMSMGGYGTFYQAYNNPTKYAAIAPMCGYYPDEIFSDLTSIKNIPIWLGHSKTDNVVKFSESEKIYQRLIAAGAKDIQTTWLEDYKHDMTKPFYDNAEFWQWLMSKKK